MSNQPSPGILKLFVTRLLPSPTHPPPPLNCLPRQDPIGFHFLFLLSSIVPGTQCCRGLPSAEMRRGRSPLAVGLWPLLPTRHFSTMSPKLPA